MLAILIGFSVLAGWLLDFRPLMTVLPGFVAMKPNAGVAFCFAGLSLFLFLLSAKGQDRRWRKLSIALAGAVVTIGVLTLGEYAVGINLGIDELLFRDFAVSRAPGRMAPLTAINFVCLGLALIFLSFPKRTAWAHALPGWVAFTSLLAVVGYFFEVDSLYRSGQFTAVALHTAIGFLLLSIGVWCASSRYGFMRLVTGSGTSGLLVRRYGLAVVVLPLLIGWLHMQGELYGLYGEKFGAALFAMTNVVTFACLVWLGARSLRTTEHREALVQERLRQVHRELEERVRERTEELATANAALQVENAERRQTEETLRESEEKFRQLAASVTDVFYINSPDLQQLHYVSPAYEQIWGRSTESLYANPQQWAEAILPEERERVIAAFSGLATEETSVSVEFRIARPDGAVRWILSRGFQVRDAAGKVIRITGVAADITERKQAEIALRESQRFAESIAENSTNIIYLFDLETRASVYTNRNAAEALGYSPAQILELGDDFLSAIIHPEDLPRVAQQLVLLTELPDGGIADIEYRVKHASGEWRWMWARETVFNRRPNGAVWQIMGTAQDITERRRIEQELEEAKVAAAVREGAQRYNFLADTVPQIIWTAQPGGCADYYNKAWFDYTGLTLAQTKDWGWGAVVHPDDLQLCIDQWTHSLTTGENFEIEYRFKRAADGTYRWFLGRASAHRNEAGEIVQWVGTSADIDDQKRARSVLEGRVAERTAELAKTNEALLRQQTELRVLFDLMPAMIWFKDTENRILRVNKRVADSVGKSVAEIEGKLSFEIYPDDAARFHADDLEVIRSRVPKLGYVETIRDRDGNELWVQTDKVPYTDEDGKVVGIVVMAQDVTERKQMEAARDRLAAILEATPDLVGIANPAGHHIYLNRAGRRLVGLGLDEDVTQTCIAEFSPDPASHPATAEAVSTAVRTGTWSGETVLISRTGQEIPVSQVILAHKNSAGELEFLSTIIRDMTGRHQAEAELRDAKESAESANRAKSEFLAKMSHEIRTPMNGIIGMTGLLLDSDLDAEQRGFAETIHSSGESLLTVINDILDFSKIEAGKLTFEELDFDLPEAVHGSLEMLAQRAESKGLELACLLEPGVPVHLRGDPGRLRQVLINFVGNAIKFTERGEVVVKVSVESETEADAILRFEVKDTGIGIQKDAQARLFQPFSQADGSTTRKYGGTGLGLVISKQLIECMHGAVGVESVLGQGSVFWFTARLTKQPEGAHSQDGIPGELLNLRVLVVDDNETSRQILLHQTRAWKMSSSAAGGAAAALTELRSAFAAGVPYQVVLLDMQMPGTDGLTLARTIKAERELAGVRLVLLSSFGGRINPEELKAVGIDDCLVKPVKQSLLFDSLAIIMAGGAAGSTRKINRALPSLPAAGPSAQKLRILLGEDNAVNQQVASGLLRKLGYRADVVADGTEVLKALQRIRYDVVFMDCQMPQLDGYETTRRIRQLEEKRATPFDWKAPIHIIAMTANAMEGDREKCLAAGMSDYLSKPVRRNELKAALDRCREILTSAVPDSSVDPEWGAAPSLPLATLSNLASSEDLLVDIDRLRDVVDNEPARMQQLIDLYLTQAVPMLDGLDQAIQANASGDVARIAHKLVGSSVSCGVEAFTHPLRELERLGHEGDLAGAHLLFDEVRQKFPRVQRVLTQLMPHPSSLEVTIP